MQFDVSIDEKQLRNRNYSEPAARDQHASATRRLLSLRSSAFKPLLAMDVHGTAGAGPGSVIKAPQPARAARKFGEFETPSATVAAVVGMSVI